MTQAQAGAQPHEGAPYQWLLTEQQVPTTTQREGGETEAEEATGTLPQPSSKPEKAARCTPFEGPELPPGGALKPSPPQDLLILHLRKFQQGLRAHSQGHSQSERRDAACPSADKPSARNEIRQLRQEAEKL